MAAKQGKRRKTPAAEDVSRLFEPYVWEWFEAAFGRPSPPQVASWPKIAEEKNTLIFSPTGSGKTLAAFLACINELFRMGAEQDLSDSIHVLYISPLKALNNDIQKNLIEPLAGIKKCARRAGVKAVDVRSRVRTGDTTQQERAAMARRPPHIFITTPESLYIILATQKFRHALKSVKYVIVDEIHAVSDNKRGVHLSLSLERLQHLADEEFVRIGLSATQKPLDEIAGFLVGMDEAGRQRPCEIVDIGARKNLNVSVISPVDNLLESHFDAIWGSAYDKMIGMIGCHDTTLVFTNSRYKTERTALRLNELSADNPVVVGAHHGSMSKEVRLDMENRLKTGELDALVATSSLELGIDVGSIDLVCQISSPKSVSKGLQRIGRAGHLLDATSEGRLLVVDRDDLVESAVLVRAIMDGRIDTTRVPLNCLDVLAQQVVGAVAADEWGSGDLYRLFRRSYCYRDLPREQYDRVLEMLAGEYRFGIERAPYPKITWDKVNNALYPERAARMIAFRASGTIPDTADYDVYFEERKTKVGQLDEGFVEELRAGDIFVLGSSSWRVLGIRRNRVLVADVYGRAPTIPFWMGDRDSRTYDLGVLVGEFRREMGARVGDSKVIPWLEKEYYVDPNGARSIYEYFREQKLVTGDVPSDKLLLVEHFRDELGNGQIVIHSPFGVRVNDTWALALCHEIEQRDGFRVQSATVDDGILITVPKGKEIDPESVLGLVTTGDLADALGEVVLNAPVFASRFRHNAVRSLLVLRESRGRRTPVWLQNLRASSLLTACRDDAEFPPVRETLRECMNEALDVPNLRKVLSGLESGEIEVRTLATEIPSPFTHALLLLGQYGDMGAIPTRERRSRLMHLHRELLRQILDEETLRNLLDADAVEQVDSRLQRTDPQRRARDANEMARCLSELGDLVDVPDDEISLLDRAEGDGAAMLARLVEEHRAVSVPISTAETGRQRWIATENFPLYRAAFAAELKRDAADRKVLAFLAKEGPCALSRVKGDDAVEQRVDRLINAYEVIRLPADGGAQYVASRAWAPKKILAQKMSREDARLELVQKFLRWHGPVTKYEVMERYGFPDGFVASALERLREEGSVVAGEYVPTKSIPQWCHRANLEDIHRLTLNRLRREMEPATPEEYADFLIRWQHVHPDTQLAGIDGLRQIIEQLQGLESMQVLFERDLFPARVKDYQPAMLDRLCYGGEVVWRRLGYKDLKRGRIGFCFRRDSDWVAPNPNEVKMDVQRWDDDIAAECGAVREYLRTNGACFFDDMVSGTKLDWRLALRAIWHLVWTGEATNDSYESIRHARFNTGLSGSYDLDSTPTKAGVTIERIVRHMLENRKLDPRLGRWSPTERLTPSETDAPKPDAVAQQWAGLLLKRHGIVCRDVMKREVCPLAWTAVRRALIKRELLGEVRRGLFVQGFSGEQYAWPEAIDALRDAKLRCPDTGDEGASLTGDSDEPMVALTGRDPANPFGTHFPVVDETGAEMARRPGDLVVLAGQPIIVGYARLVVDLSREQAEKAVRALMARGQVRIDNWNGHPIDVSPARLLLTKLGFVEVKKAFICDGTYTPNEETLAAAETEMPGLFERDGKEEAPVEYDAEWIISRSHRKVQGLVRKLIRFLRGMLPAEYEFVYRPRRFMVCYRGVGIITPRIGQKQIWLQMFHRGWTPGMVVDGNTDFAGDQLPSAVLERLAKARRLIDAELDGDKDRP